MATSPARVLLRGGSIFSPTHPAATAMLTIDDRVAWVGDESGAEDQAAAADVVVDLDGRLVAPGFVDAHVHLSKTGFALQSVDLGTAGSLGEALQMVEAHAAADRGSVVFAHGWDDSAWPEARAFTASELDSVVGGRSAYVSRVDGHSAVVSTALLRSHPSIEEREGWRGDGLVSRDAHHAARSAVDELWTHDERCAALLLALRAAAGSGLTEVHEMNAPHIAPYDDADLVVGLRSRHVLPEVVSYWGALAGGDHADAPVAGFAGDLCVDGAIGSRTAALSAPYEKEESDGFLYLDAHTIRTHVLDCTHHGIQAGFHAIGDRGVETALAGLREAALRCAAGELVRCRHRLEHVEMVQPVGIELMVELGIVASVQPAFDAAWGGLNGLYERRLGSLRAGPMNPFGSMLRAGVMLAFGSDSPVTPFDPWGGVRAAVRHHNPDERLSVAAAFDAHTRGGHRAHGDDDGGVLQPGATASYAVWDVADPGADGLPDLGSADCATPSCVRTVVAGLVAFEAGEAS